MSRLLPALLALALVLTACGTSVSPPPETLSAEPLAADEPDPEPEPEPEPEPDEPVDDRDRSPLTGEPLDAELLDRPLLIAKIENSPQSRPQSGLDVADVVYEEVVEGGITRFFVLFHSELPAAAGPIRSARPVDTQLMAGYGRSGFAYSGAREEVQALLAGTPNVRVTEGGAGFYRDSSRSAPHNLYLRPAETVAALVERDAELLADVGWVFDEQVPDGAVACPDDAAGCTDPGVEVDLAMSREFQTGWSYDEQAGVYRRSQNGASFAVTGDGQIGAANVVALEARHYIGASGYPETDVVVDDGRAIVWRDGQRFELRWSKPGPAEPLRLLTGDGEPFPLKPGPTWLHLPEPRGMPAPLG